MGPKHCVCISHGGGIEKGAKNGKMVREGQKYYTFSEKFVAQYPQGMQAKKSIFF